MTYEDLIWLAGLLEGEGTFDLHRGKYPRIRVGMTDRDVVGRAATLLEANVRTTLRPKPLSATFHAEVSGARAAEVMALLLPHMGARRSSKIATVLGHAQLGDGVGILKTTPTGAAPGPKLVRPPALRGSA